MLAVTQDAYLCSLCLTVDSVHWNYPKPYLKLLSVSEKETNRSSTWYLFKALCNIYWCMPFFFFAFFYTQTYFYLLSWPILENLCILFYWNPVSPFIPSPLCVFFFLPSFPYSIFCVTFSSLCLCSGLWCVFCTLEWVCFSSVLKRWVLSPVFPTCFFVLVRALGYETVLNNSESWQSSQGKVDLPWNSVKQLFPHKLPRRREKNLRLKAQVGLDSPGETLAFKALCCFAQVKAQAYFFSTKPLNKVPLSFCSSVTHTCVTYRLSLCVIGRRKDALYFLQSSVLQISLYPVPLAATDRKQPWIRMTHLVWGIFLCVCS